MSRLSVVATLMSLSLVGWMAAVSPRVALLCLVTAATLSLALRFSRGDSALATIIVGSYGLRLIVGVLQAKDEVFVSNADALVYQRFADFLLIAGTDHWSAHVPVPFRGIVALDLAVASFAGGPALLTTLSWVAASASAIGCTLVIAGAAPKLSRIRLHWLAVVLSVWPSIVFFGSMNLKEPYLILGLGMIYWSLAARPRFRIVGALTGVVLCIAMRPYIGLLILAAVLAMVVVRRVGLTLRAKTGLAVALLLVLTAARLGPSYVGVEISEQRQFSIEAGGASVVRGAFSWLQILFPWPPWLMPGSQGQALLYLDSLAQGVLGLLLVWTLLLRRACAVRGAEIFCVILIPSAYVIYGLAVANAGTLVRERAPFTVLLVVVTMILVRRPGSPEPQPAVVASAGRTDHHTAPLTRQARTGALQSP